MKKFVFFGQRNPLGGGVHFSNFMDQIKLEMKTEVELVEVDTQSSDAREVIAEASKADALIFFYPNRYDKILKGRKIKWAIFESNVLSPDYLRYLNDSIRIWAPSEWAKSILKANGLDGYKVDIIPLGVDPDLYYPNKIVPRANNQPFKFLACGKKEIRKGLSELLQGFHIAFKNDPNFQLILKTGFYCAGSDVWRNKSRELRAEIDALGLLNVVQIDELVSTKAMSGLYQSADAFIHPSRAEGWGLPLMDALACGLPVAAIKHSGQTEYLKTIDGLYSEIPHRMEAISCPEFNSLWGDHGDWSVASAKDISDTLITMVQNFDELRTKALKASRIIRERFGWVNSVQVARESLANS